MHTCTSTSDLQFTSGVGKRWLERGTEPPVRVLGGGIGVVDIAVGVDDRMAVVVGRVGIGGGTRRTQPPVGRLFNKIFPEEH